MSTKPFIHYVLEEDREGAAEAFQEMINESLTHELENEKAFVAYEMFSEKKKCDDDKYMDEDDHMSDEDDDMDDDDSMDESKEGVTGKGGEGVEDYDDEEDIDAGLDAEKATASKNKENMSKGYKGNA